MAGGAEAEAAALGATRALGLETPLSLFLEELGGPAGWQEVAQGSRLFHRVWKLGLGAKGFVLRLLIARSLGGKVRAVRGWIFPGREFIERRYGPGFWLLKAILRPFLLLGRLGRSLRG